MRPAATIAVAIALAVCLPAGSDAASSRTGRPVCDALVVHEPRQIRDALMEMGAPVLGKPPLTWTEDDFDRVYQAADYCDGVRDAGTNSTIRGSAWRSYLDPAREVVLTTAMGIREAENLRQTTRTKSIVLPACERLAEWTHDPRDFRNNSSALFGRDVLDTPFEDLAAAMGYVRVCAPAVARLATARHKLNEGETQRRLQSLVEVYSSVQSAHADRRSAGQLPTDMMAYLDGKPLPSTLASRRTQTLVREVNQFSAERSRIPAQQVDNMSREASEIAAEAKTRIDLVWAEAIKDRLARDIFTEQP